MKTNRIIFFLLVCFLLSALCGCGDPNVKFVAKIADSTRQIGYGDGNAVILESEFSGGINVLPYIGKKTELVGTKETFLIDGKHVELTYDDTTYYPDGTYMNLYRNEEYVLEINQKDDYVTLWYMNPIDIDNTPITKEQRKEVATDIIYDFCGVDVTNFEFSEQNTISGYASVFKHKLYGKYTGRRIQVTFTEDGKLVEIFSQTGVYFDEMSHYPDFDRDECYEAAKNKLLESIKGTNTCYYYASYPPCEQYIEIDGKLYFMFEFSLDSHGSLTEHTEYTGNIENFRFSTGTRVTILVELITE